MAFIFSDNFVLLHAVILLNETVIESNYQTLLEHSVLKTAKIIQAKGIGRFPYTKLGSIMKYHKSLR